MGTDQEVIDSFNGPYAFLSNFYEHDGRITAEHLFQSMKTDDPFSQLWILAAPSPKEAKARGRKVALRSDWDDVKIGVMECVLAIKFASGTVMSHWLQDTRDAELIEGNYWNDTFWGVCNGVGENWLGKLLMERRQKNREANYGQRLSTSNY